MFSYTIYVSLVQTILTELTTYLEVLHGEVDTVGLAVGDLEVAWPCRTSADNDSIVLGSNLINVDITSHMGIRDERLKGFIAIVNKGSDPSIRCNETYHSLCGHQIQTTLDDALIQLHANR